MILPNDIDGIPYISYSQYVMWNQAKSFSLKTKGMFEYMASYFMGYEANDEGWAQFGKEVEGYITEGEFSESFTDEELRVLDSVETFGVYQQEIRIDLGGFICLGYIDDMMEDYSIIQDFKTASKNSSKKYTKDSYKQMDIYSMWVHQEKGFIPKAQVCVIERKGNCMLGAGREALTVGESFWIIDRTSNIERIEAVKKDIINTAKEIEKYYKLYLKITAK